MTLFGERMKGVTAARRLDDRGGGSAYWRLPLVRLRGAVRRSGGGDGGRQALSAFSLLVLCNMVMCRGAVGWLAGWRTCSRAVAGAYSAGRHPTVCYFLWRMVNGAPWRDNAQTYCGTACILPSVTGHSSLLNISHLPALLSLWSLLDSPHYALVFHHASISCLLLFMPISLCLLSATLPLYLSHLCCLTNIATWTWLRCNNGDDRQAWRAA